MSERSRPGEDPRGGPAGPTADERPAPSGDSGPPKTLLFGADLREKVKAAIAARRDGARSHTARHHAIPEPEAPQRGAYRPAAAPPTQSTALVPVAAPPQIITYAVPPQPPPRDGTQFPRRSRQAATPDLDVERRGLPEKVDDRLVLLRAAETTQTIAYHALRQRLQERGDPQVIAVTSARAGDGKSTCAANLALALAESQRWKVVLIEINPRRPNVGALFGFEPGVCFCDQLGRLDQRAKRPPTWSVVQLDPVGLHVLAIRPEKKPQVITGAALVAAIDSLCAAYDYVIVDAPGLLAGRELQLAEDALDAVVLVARSGQARAKDLRLATEQMSAQLLAGVVVLDA